MRIQIILRFQIGRKYTCLDFHSSLSALFCFALTVVTEATPRDFVDCCQSWAEQNKSWARNRIDTFQPFSCNLIFQWRIWKKAYWIMRDFSHFLLGQKSSSNIQRINYGLWKEFLQNSVANRGYFSIPFPRTKRKRAKRKHKQDLKGANFGNSVSWLSSLTDQSRNVIIFRK